MENFFEDFVKEIKTKEELILSFEEITQAERIIFEKKSGPLSEKIKGKVREKFREFIKRMEDKEILSQNPTQQRSFLEKLKKYLSSLPEVKLEIAFSPSNEFLKKINQWFNEKLAQKVILDLTINPKIVGGIVIEYKGNWRDYSLAKRIDKLIEKSIPNHGRGV